MIGQKLLVTTMIFIIVFSLTACSESDTNEDNNNLSVIDASINDEGELILVYSDESTRNIGQINSIEEENEYDYTNTNGVQLVSTVYNDERAYSYVGYNFSQGLHVNIPDYYKGFPIRTLGESSLVFEAVKSVYIPKTVDYVSATFHRGFDPRTGQTEYSDFLVIYTEHSEKPDNWIDGWSIGPKVYWGVKEYNSSDGYEYVVNQDNEVIIRGLSYDNENTDLVIPSSIDGKPVTTIQENAFKSFEWGSDMLKVNIDSIFIPETVTSVGVRTFDDNSGLTIYVEADSKPDGWDDNWNPDDIAVEWGYQK